VDLDAPRNLSGLGGGLFVLGFQRIGGQGFGVLAQTLGGGKRPGRFAQVGRQPVVLLQFGQSQEACFAVSLGDGIVVR